MGADLINGNWVRCAEDSYHEDRGDCESCLERERLEGSEFCERCLQAALEEERAHFAEVLKPLEVRPVENAGALNKALEDLGRAIVNLELKRMRA